MSTLLIIQQGSQVRTHSQDQSTHVGLVLFKVNNVRQHVTHSTVLLCLQVSHRLSGIWSSDSFSCPTGPDHTGIPGAETKRFTLTHFLTTMITATIITVLMLTMFVHAGLDNSLSRFIMTCMKCCFWCLDRVIRYLNRNAYIMVSWFK